MDHKGEVRSRHLYFFLARLLTVKLPPQVLSPASKPITAQERSGSQEVTGSEQLRQSASGGKGVKVIRTGRESPHLRFLPDRVANTSVRHLSWAMASPWPWGPAEAEYRLSRASPWPWPLIGSPATLPDPEDCLLSCTGREGMGDVKHARDGTWDAGRMSTWMLSILRDSVPSVDDHVHGDVDAAAAHAGGDVHAEDSRAVSVDVMWHAGVGDAVDDLVDQHHHRHDRQPHPRLYTPLHLFYSSVWWSDFCW